MKTFSALLIVLVFSCKHQITQTQDSQFKDNGYTGDEIKVGDVASSPLSPAVTKDIAKELSKKWFALSFTRLLLGVQACLAKEEVCLGFLGEKTPERIRAKVLLTIIQGTALDLNPNMLEFVDGKSDSLFNIDGAVRIAATEAQPYSKIYINSDLLYQIDRVWGGYKSISLPEATSIIIHELGHQLEKYDYMLPFTAGILKKMKLDYQFSHDELDMIGSLVAKVMFKEKKTLRYGPEENALFAGSNWVVIEKFNFSLIPDHPQHEVTSLYLVTSDTVIEITEYLNKKYCDDFPNKPESYWAPAGIELVFLGDVSIRRKEDYFVGETHNEDIVITTTNSVLVCDFMLSEFLTDIYRYPLTVFSFNMIKKNQRLEFDPSSFQHYAIPPGYEVKK